MARNQDSLGTNTLGGLPTKIETIVYANKDGRIVIPRDVRRVLDIEENRAKLTVYHENDSAQGIIEIDEAGRATIPVQLRRYLGIDGDDLDLQIVISRVDSVSTSTD